MHQLNSNKTIRIFIALCLLLVGQSVFSYGDDYEDVEGATSTPSHVSEMQENIEQLKKEADTQESKPTPAVGGLTPEDIKSLSEVNKSGPMGANSDSVRKSIRLINAQFKNLPDSQVSSMIKQNMQNSRFAKPFANSDKAVNFIVGLIKDDKALLYLFELTQDKKLLKNAGITILVIFILGFFIRRVFIKKTDSFLVRFTKKIFFFFTFSAIKMSVVYFFYKDYLDPSIKVFKDRVL